MEIKNLKAKNFYSFLDLSLDFTDLSGVIQIQGKNIDSGGSNGSGKSVILEAVSWGVFGKTIRKSNEESMVHTQAGEDCRVKVGMEVGGQCITIDRRRRPTRLDFYIGETNCNKENALETQKYIEEFIQADFKSFLASVVFGQHADFDFLSSSPEDKRKIIRNCFNLEDIFAKRASVKSLKSSITGELKGLRAVLSSLYGEMDKAEKLIPDKKYKYVELPPLQFVLDAEHECDRLRTEIATSKKDITVAKTRLRKVRPALERGEYKEDKECPICKNTYLVTQGEDEVSNLKEESQTLGGLVSDWECDVERAESKIKEKTPYYPSNVWAKYNEKNVLLKEAKAATDNYEALKFQIEDLESKTNTLEQDIEVMKFWEKAFSEQGMIRYVIRTILEYFNLKSNEYLSILTNNQFSVIFADDLSETITNNGKEVKFISLSGGEKKKVNLAIMLALQDLQQKISRTKSNLIFFDEVGENLDDISMESIFTLLNILKNQDDHKVIFVITHNTILRGFLSDSHSITVKKHKGVSRLDGGS